MIEAYVERAVPLCKVAEGCAVVLFAAVAITEKGYSHDLWLTVAMYACALSAEICARAAKREESEEQECKN